MALLLALFGASTQCVADCLTQPKVPPCHKHSQSKTCDHVQVVADVQAIGPPAAETPALAQAAFEFIATDTLTPDQARLALSVLRL
jgi:hypothetical protein